MKRKREIKTGNIVTDRLYKAVINYIEENGGSVVVIGGITIVGEGLDFNHGLMVNFTGKKPISNNKQNEK